MRSAPLVKLGTDTRTAIDELINTFLDRHVPNEISKWEEEMSFVWMTMIPLVHLAFARGEEHNSDSEMNCSNHGIDINRIKCDSSAQSEEAYFCGNKRSKTDAMEVADADIAAVSDSQSSYQSLNSKELERHLAAQNVLSFSSSTVYNVSRTMKDEDSFSESDSVKEDRKDQFTWPGSTSTHKLGIFSLVHMLSIKENQQLASSENLLPYLVCLSWHLQSDEKEKLRTIMAHFYDVSTPPSLKVVAKSALALVKGLDMVFNL